MFVKKILKFLINPKNFKHESNSHRYIQPTQVGACTRTHRTFQGHNEILPLPAVTPYIAIPFTFSGYLSSVWKNVFNGDHMTRESPGWRSLNSMQSTVKSTYSAVISTANIEMTAKYNTKFPSWRSILTVKACLVEFDLLVGSPT